MPNLTVPPSCHDYNLSGWYACGNQLNLFFTDELSGKPFTLIFKNTRKFRATEMYLGNNVFSLVEIINSEQDEWLNWLGSYERNEPTIDEVNGLKRILACKNFALYGLTPSYGAQIAFISDRGCSLVDGHVVEVDR